MKFEVVENPDPKLMTFFEKRLEEFNEVRWEIKKKIPLVVQVTDDAGDILAGVSARTFGAWLLIDNLWVSEKLRGQDIGTQILKTLEDTARKRGCKYAMLDTLNFQARPFYERFGYSVKWTMESYPTPKDCKHFLMKTL